MYTYQNKTDHDLSLPGIGTVKAKATIEHFAKIENPNLNLIGGEAPKTVTGTEAPQQAAIVNGAPAAGTEII